MFTGQDFLDLLDYDQSLYVTGLNDAYNWSVAAGFQRLQWLVDCSRGKTAEQLAAIFKKWLTENPERWQAPAAKLYAFALFAACDAQRQRGEP